MYVTYQTSGRRITVVGAVDSPGTYGYPSVSYTIDNGGPTTVDLTNLDQFTNPTGVTPFMTLYQSDWVDTGVHTLKWTVNNVSPSGAKFYLDLFMIEGAEISSSKNCYVPVDDADGDISWAGGWQEGVFTGEYMGTHTLSTASGSSLTYTFTGTHLVPSYFHLPFSCSYHRMEQVEN